MRFNGRGNPALFLCEVKMKNIEKEILLETYRPWVKKLEQWHLADDDGKTRCGKPMLGNNYAKYIPEDERTECPDCFK
jgi:hypothetical protein